MEPSGTRGDSCTEERSRDLAEAFTRLLAASRPSQDPADLARVIFSSVRGAEEEECHHDNAAELTCLSLSLLERMSSSLTSPGAEVTWYCEEVLKVLFEDLDLMAQLVRQFQCSDQIAAHQAAKTSASRVFHDLQTSGRLSPAWQRRCEEVFLGSDPGPELDCCLWSLTRVLKQLLKAACGESVRRLLVTFDPSLAALCSRFLPVNLNGSRRWASTFCLLLDLLEVLTASSLVCGPDVCGRSQRLAHTHWPSLLATVSCSADYFVKKRVLLLLKRVLLQQAGEDWRLGHALAAGRKHPPLSSSTSMLAHSVLQALGADWLRSVEVASASFFGGTSHMAGGGAQDPDCVMLRALSLLLLKSIEFHVQSDAGTGASGASEVYGYLQVLWGFLRRCGVRPMDASHSCSFLTLLFADQDDDMMEAAKAALSIFLHRRLGAGSDGLTALEAACASGCNPHCHFLFLLQSVSFDHSTLLDFLISTETCFLEYFVRYLKYLRSDWQGFAAACRRASDFGGASEPADRRETAGSSGVQPAAVPPPASPALRLVEYDGSDESDPDSMEVSQDSLTTPAELHHHHVRPWPPVRQSCDSAEPLTSPSVASGGTLTRALVCLSMLREVVARLQTRKLFPYNPSALLRLLADVDGCWSQ